MRSLYKILVVCPKFYCNLGFDKSFKFQTFVSNR